MDDELSSHDIQTKFNIIDSNINALFGANQGVLDNDGIVFTKSTYDFDLGRWVHTDVGPTWDMADLRTNENVLNSRVNLTYRQMYKMLKVWYASGFNEEGL